MVVLLSLNLIGVAYLIYLGRKNMATFNELLTELDGMSDAVTAVTKVMDELINELEGAVGSQATIQAAINKARTNRDALVAAALKGTAADPNPEPEEPPVEPEPEPVNPEVSGQSIVPDKTDPDGTKAGAAASKQPPKSL